MNHPVRGVCWKKYYFIMGIFDFIFNKKNLEYDTFPVNILEMFGPIERHDFRFYSKKMTIFQQRNAKSFEIDNFVEANVQGKSMNVRFSCKPLGAQIANITFPEVSENKDRILWSYNLSGGGYGLPEDYPSFMSLYYIKGKLAKVGFTFKCANPEFIIEFE